MITESVGDGDAAQEVCVTADDHFLAESEATTLAEMLITAATSPAAPGAGGHALPARSWVADESVRQEHLLHPHQ